MSLVPVYASKRAHLHASSTHVSTGQSRKRAVEQGKSRTISGYALVSILSQEEKGQVAAARAPTPLLDIGFTSVVLCFVKLSGGQIPQEDLVRHLEAVYTEDRLLGVGKTVHVLLDTLCRQKYVTIFNHADGERVMWGARAEVEFANDDIAAFLVDLYRRGAKSDEDVRRLQERLSATTIS